MTSSAPLSIIPDYSIFDDDLIARMEQATTPPARAMILQSGILSAPGELKVLDNACGAGVLSAVLLEEASKELKERMELVCGDLDQNMIGMVGARIKDKGWKATAQIVDAQAITFPDSTFSHVFVNFGIQLFPDPDLAVSELTRILRSGGTLGYTSWTSPGWIPLLQRADPTFVVPALFSSPWNTPSTITSSLTSLGFHSIVVAESRFETIHPDAKEWVEGMGKVVPPYAGEVGKKVLKLLEEEQGTGAFKLEWVAWVVTAVKI